MRASTFALARTRVGAAETDTASAASPIGDALAGAGKALPVFALGALGAVFGGTLWGLGGLVGGALAGSGAGYGVTRLASGAKASDGQPEAPSAPESPDLGSLPDFSAPKPGTFMPPMSEFDFPTLPFPDVPTFLPTPSQWIPVSVRSSRASVDKHRGLVPGIAIEFIAQYGLRDEEDTSNEIKIEGKIVVARKALTDQDPAYGIEVIALLKDHEVSDKTPRPVLGQRMVVSPDQVIAAGVPGSTTKTGALSEPEEIHTGATYDTMMSRMPPWLRGSPAPMQAQRQRERSPYGGYQICYGWGLRRGREDRGNGRPYNYEAAVSEGVNTLAATFEDYHKTRCANAIRDGYSRGYGDTRAPVAKQRSLRAQEQVMAGPSELSVPTMAKVALPRTEIR